MLPNFIWLKFKKLLYECVIKIQPIEGDSTHEHLKDFCSI